MNFATNRMRFALLIALAMACAPAFAQQLVGTFNSKFSDEAGSAALVLSCESGPVCALVTETQDTKSVLVKSAKWLAIRELKSYREVTVAFRYALEHRKAVLRENSEYAAIMKQLRPILEEKAAIDRCWDLNEKNDLEEGFMVACSVANASKNRSSLLLMATLLSDNCTPPFCRYVIYPMQREPSRETSSTAPAMKPSAEALMLVTKQGFDKNLLGVGFTTVTRSGIYASIAAKLGKEDANSLIKREFGNVLPKYQERWNNEFARSFAEFLSPVELASVAEEGVASRYGGKYMSVQAEVSKNMQSRSMPMLAKLIAEVLGKSHSSAFGVK